MLSFKNHNHENITRVKDLICWRFHSGYRCLSAADSLLATSIRIVIIPIYSKFDKDVLDRALGGLRQVMAGCRILHHIDDDDRVTAGSKFNKWEQLGVPIRLELGPKEAFGSCVSLVVHPSHAENFDLEELDMSQMTTSFRRGSLVISSVPFSAVIDLCETLLNHFKPQSDSCTKLHLSASTHDSSICISHLKHLVASDSKPCHCHQGHLSLSELKEQVEASQSNRQGSISWFRIAEGGEEKPSLSDDEAEDRSPCTLLVSGHSNENESQLSDRFAPFGLVHLSSCRGRPVRVTLESVAAARRAMEVLKDEGLDISFQLGRRDKLFPHLSYETRAKMRVGARAAYSMTDQLTADQMTETMALIASALWRIEPDKTKILPLTVTDATACCGGNSLSFLSRFKRVVAVELDEDIYSDLSHNLIFVLGFSCDRLTLHCADYLDIGFSLRQHCVFIDPPWCAHSGPGYDKSTNVLCMKLGSMAVTDICIKLLRPAARHMSSPPPNFEAISETSTRMIALKLPTRSTDPQALFSEITKGLEVQVGEGEESRFGAEAAVSGVSVRFGRSLLVVISVGLLKEDMQSLMKKRSNEINSNLKLHYQLLKL